MKNVKYSCHFQWLNTEHRTHIAIRHTRSCILSSQLLFIMKQTRRWSVRFIQHRSECNRNKFSRTQPRSNHEHQIKLWTSFSLRFVVLSMEKGSIGKPNQEDKKTFMLQLLLLLLLLFCFASGKKTLRSKANRLLLETQSWPSSTPIAQQYQPKIMIIILVFVLKSNLNKQFKQKEWKKEKQSKPKRLDRLQCDDSDHDHDTRSTIMCVWITVIKPALLFFYHNY